MKLPRLGSRADGLALLALLALDLSAYGLLLDPGQMLVDYDALVYFYPLRAYAAMAVQEGRLPLWNPHSFLGVPFLANPQTALFYPLTALFFWLPVPQAYGLSLLLHVLLGGVGFYALCRVALRTAPLGALIGASAFMLSGVLSGQYGHLNQISAVAWLPFVLLLGDLAIQRRSVRLALASGAMLGVQLLAGHPQQSFMTLLALGLLGLWRAWALGAREIGRAVVLLGLAAGFGLGLAAVQLVPMAELASVSIRGSGLSFREAVAGSLWPWLLARALLPGSATELGSTEYLGYAGVIPLLLAAVALGAADWRRASLGGLFVLIGLGLALGAANPIYALLHEFVPGFGSFRVPARWLLLYTVGAAMLAAVGTDWLLQRHGKPLSEGQWQRLLATSAGLLLALLAFYVAGDSVERSVQVGWVVSGLLGLVLAAGCARGGMIARLAGVGLVIVVGMELWLAGGGLPPRWPVPMEAYAQPRDSTLFVQSRLANGRFLSVATEEYELKETPDYRERYAHLPEEALVGFLIAAKRNEALTPNLNLLYRIPSLDGYDGGLLPLQRYLSLASLLVPEDRLRSDGVLISRMDSLPARRLMDLLNLRVVLASRAKDYVSDGLPHDGSILVELAPGERLELRRVPRRAFSTLSMISAVEEPVPPPGSPVAELEVTTTQGTTSRVPIIVEQHTAAARPTAPVGGQLEVVRPWSWNVEGDPVEYLGEIGLPDGELERLAIVNSSREARLRVRALTLIDNRDGAVSSLVLDDRIERTEFFDMKVYEYPEVQSRAYLVHQAAETADPEALGRLAEADFNPRREAVVEPGAGLQLQPGGDGERVIVEEDQPERLRLRVLATSPALLVLSDAHAPGWSVRVDGLPARLLRANVALRGVAVPAGEHEVVFSYAPRSLQIGALVSATSLVLGMMVLVLVSRRSGQAQQRRARATGRW